MSIQTSKAFTAYHTCMTNSLEESPSWEAQSLS